MSQKKNCRNCGAPLNKRGDCEYCGTKGEKTARSGIEIAADHITFWADGQLIDEETVEQ